MDCIKTFLEKAISTKVLPQYTLLGCKLCKLISEHKFDKNDHKHQWIYFLMLPVVELKNQMGEDKKEYSTLSKMISLCMFEEEQKRFPKESNVDEQITTFLELLKEKKINEAYHNFPEYSYYELLKRLIITENYDLFALVSFNYLSKKVLIQNATFRTRLFHKSYNMNNAYSNVPHHPFLFFDIGYSLDEGITQLTTIEVMDVVFDKMMRGEIEKKSLFESKKLTDEDIELEKNAARQMYYLEVRFVKRIFDIFPEELKKSLLGKIAFENLGVPLIYQLASYSDNACDFYNLFNYTDGQDWENAHILLSKIIKKVDINEIISKLKI